MAMEKMRHTPRVPILFLLAGLLLVPACSGPEEPTTPDDLVGLWKLDRPYSERKEWGTEYIRFTDDGRLIWGTSKGGETTGTEVFRYRVEGDDTIILDPPPSPDAGRVLFHFNGKGWLITEVGGRELKYRRQRD